MHIAFRLLTLTTIAAALQAETNSQKPYDRTEWKKKYLRPKEVPYPRTNGFTVEKEVLGKNLFFDPRLSGSGLLSCASCHNPSFSWGDGMPRAVGHGMQVLGRRTPTILNLAWSELLFWDGRAGSLEEQALGPIQAPGEMNMPLPAMLTKLKAISGYKPLFESAYPGQGITESTVAKAIATFERGVVSADAPFDHWVAGKEDAISAKAKLGFDLFNTKASCHKCHSEWNFTDDGFHDIGIQCDDRGRGKLLPKLEAMGYAFKTPTLRNASQRAPFLHDGSESSLESIVDFYDKGGAVKRPSLAPEMQRLNLTPDEKGALVEFLKTLTSADKPVALPVLPQ